jgi:membrane associated rhomboid family serine protease
MTWRPEWEEPPRRGFGFGRGPGGWGVARTLVALCVVVTLVNMVLAGQASTEQGSVTLGPWLGLTLRNAFWVYPWFTYVFVHDASGISHILFNGVLLWFLGIELEQRLGRGRFLTLFFGSALVGAVAHVIAQAAIGGNEASALIGASGGIFGLLFYIARETPDRPFVFWIVPVPAKVLAGLFVIRELFPLIQGGLGGDGVAHLCHLGGAAFGLLWYRRPFNAFDGFSALASNWRAHAQEQRRERAEGDDAEMDRLLRKIHDSGMGSLDARERAFLDERSRRMRGGGT